MGRNAWFGCRHTNDRNRRETVSRPAATQGQLVGGRWHLCCPAEHVVHRISADRAHVDERGAVGIRAGAGGRDRAAIRRANAPGAAARADEKVGEGVGLGDYYS